MTCTRKQIVRLKSGYLVRVGCGKCPDCLKNKQRELALRLHYDLDSPRCFDSIFFTLTYDDEHLEYVDHLGNNYPLPSVNKATLQKFLKRVRKKLNYNPNTTQLLYYCTGEYGATKRPHYHGIIYLLGSPTCNISLLDALKSSWNLCDWSNISTAKCFQSTKSIASTMYVAKHQVKRCQGIKDLQSPFFQIRSKGIGSQFFTEKKWSKDVDFLKKNMFLWFNNIKVPAPRFFLDKLELYRSELELLKLQKMQNDKELIKFNQAVENMKLDYPQLTLQQIYKHLFKNAVSHETYKDKYFEIMYKKLSQTSNF